jgi:hexosaminidase
MPTKLIRSAGSFVLRRDTAIRAHGGAEPAARLLRRYFRKATGFPLPSAEAGTIVLTLDPGMTGLGEEGYSLLVSTHAVLLRAPHPAGLLHGVQSLRQLLATEGGPHLPCVDIRDVPVFPWRGAMLDVARHFMPIGFVRRFVDLLALHKLNVLHLHLTDDQGWRMPIERYPRLTDIGALRTESMIGPSGSPLFDGTPHGGAYTRAELEGLVAYAAELGVTVMPEIEMPGHARAALAAYPELGNFPSRELPVWTSWGVSDALFGVQDRTFDFLQDVLTEVMEVFPSPRIHIGGDECPTVEWRTSPTAAVRIAAEGLSGADALHGWFLRRVGDFLLDHGRQPVCWDDGDLSAGLPPQAAVMIWRDPAHGLSALRRGHEVIMAPFRSTYLDYPQSAEPEEPQGQPDGVVTLHDVYHHQPVPPEWDDRYRAGVLGTQAQLWTEFAPRPRDVEYLAFPRLCALAETSWRGNNDWSGFPARLVRHEQLLSALSVHYRPVGAFSAI